jgi:hypothetical protein
MHLTTCRTLDGLLILDGEHFERLRVHREARINQFARFWALDHYAVHPFLINIQADEVLQIRVRYLGLFLTRPYLAHLTCALTCTVLSVGDISFDMTR